MSRSADSPTDASFGMMGRLEGAVARALERVRQLEREVDEARGQTADLDRVLLRVTGGELPPSALLERVQALEGENAALRGRISDGRERIERLLAKIRFLEEQR